MYIKQDSIQPIASVSILCRLHCNLNIYTIHVQGCVLIRLFMHCASTYTEESLHPPTLKTVSSILYMYTVCTYRYHLNGTDVLGLFNINMCQVEPDVWQLGCCLSHLSKHIPSFTIITFMGKYGAYRGGGMKEREYGS